MNNNLDNIFLSYNEILKRLQILGKTTKSGKEITHKDLRKAICVMEDKHSNCRWKSEKIRSKRHYILIEGFYWLIYVYFNKDKKLMDADIDFFKSRIKQDEELLKVESKEIFTKDIKCVSLGKLSSEVAEFILKKRPDLTDIISAKQEIIFWANRVAHTERHKNDFMSEVEYFQGE